MFTEDFGAYVCPGDTISCAVNGFNVVARVLGDDNSETPWDREDGHGPVSNWTSRPKKPGERILHKHRGSYRYYDFAEAVRIARRDGWDTPPYRQGTPGERAARAAERDFTVLKAWCNDEWWYVGVTLSISMDGIALTNDALWGIECNYPPADPGDKPNSYLRDVANELLPEALEAAKEKLRSLAAQAAKLTELKPA